MSLSASQNVVLEAVPVLDSWLVGILGAIDAAQIKYCLLRGYNLLWTEASKEIDLLVLPEHIPALEDLLRSRGFTTLPAWGHAPHRFFVSYNPASGTWLKLDLVDAVRYGEPIRALEVDITHDLLKNRRRFPYTYLPAPEEEFIKLLLHCILHKREFTEEKSLRLRELACEIGNRPAAAQKLAHHVNAYLSPAITNSMLALMALTGHYKPLLDTREEVLQRLFWAAPFGNAWRYLSTKSLLVMRPLLTLLFRRGLTIALLAPDGAGKSTLAKRLASEPFLNAQVIYMGTNGESQTRSLRLTRWLRRRFPETFGDKPRKNRAYAFRLLNYLLALGEHWYRLGVGIYHKLRGRFVVFDRYMYDSWVNGNGKKPLRDRIFDFAWPNVDMVVVLDAPGRVLYERKREHSPEWLESRRHEYLKLQDRLPNSVFIDATRSEEEVQREAIAAIWKEYTAREQ